jgi:hypothetical protein
MAKPIFLAIPSCRPATLHLHTLSLRALEAPLGKRGAFFLQRSGTLRKSGLTGPDIHHFAPIPKMTFREFRLYSAFGSYFSAAVFHMG